MKRGDIIEYVDMITEEGSSLQRGMKFASKRDEFPHSQ